MSMHYTLQEAGAMMGLSLSGNIQDAPVITGISTDTRTLQKGDLFFALNGENFRGDDFVAAAFQKGAVAAVTDGSGYKDPVFQTSNALAALQRLAGAHRDRCPARIIGITGSCGKTTAKDMLASVLSSEYVVEKTQGNLNNDIGCPLSLLHLSQATHFGIIEMGANHIGEIRALCGLAKPDEGVVTLVAPAHLEGFGSLEGVAAAKAELMEALPEKGCFYVNMDDPLCRAMGERFRGEKVRFGTGGDVYLKELRFDDEGEMILKVHPIGTLRLPLRIRAHVSHVLLAIAAGLRHGIISFEAPLRDACKKAARFKETLFQGVHVLDDSYNANPASMKASLEALRDYPGQRRIAVLGDMFELGKTAEVLHADVGSFAASLSIDFLLSLGGHSGIMAESARQAGLEQAFTCASHQEAAAWLQNNTAAGDVVLLKGSRGMKMETVLEQWKSIAPAGQ